MAQTSADNRPSIISGGCLCGSVRYNVHFPSESLWPIAPHDCQCTQCRKWTGALICPWVEFKTSQITWPTSSSPNANTSAPQGLKAYVEYSSSPGVHRGFCNQCGSTIVWRSDKLPDEVGFTTGTIDENILIGDNKDRGSARQDQHELEVGKTLCDPVGGHLWFANAVKGVTDEVKVGKKFLEGFEGPVVE